MSLKTKLLTSVAALTLVAGPALAESHVSATGSAEAEMQMSSDDSFAPGWNADLDTAYADIADRPVAELIGMNVVTDAGDDVGEVDNFVLMEGDLRAVVGVGGFLGIGEHEVALPLSELSYDGEKLVISYTEEELRAMPEYTEELEQVALAGEDTFRTRMNEAEMATETAAAETEAAVEEGAEEVAEAADATGDAVAEGAAEAEQVAENAAEATGHAVAEGTEEVADAADATSDAIAEGAAEAEQMAENAAEATGDAVAEGTEKVAQAAEATGDAIAEGAEATEEMAENAAKETSDWFQAIATESEELADATFNQLWGYDVATANGDVIGEIDQFGQMDGKTVAIVGIGGFLGLGEHDVALDMAQLQFDGEKFIAAGYTEEELEAMPEYDAEAVTVIEGDMAIRDAAN